MPKGSKIRSIIKRSPLFPFFYRIYVRVTHKLFYKEDNLFYTLSPMLLPAIVSSFNLLKEEASGGNDLLKDTAYYEFGLFKGFSFWFAEQVSRGYTGDNFIHLGFDSFEGLPESKVDVDLKGNYAAAFDFVKEKLKENGTDLSRIKLFKGFYSDEYFSRLKEKEIFPCVSVAVIDVDLYESACRVLDFLKDYFVPGSIILFDDYNVFDKSDAHGERRAFLEFRQRNPAFLTEHIFDFGWHGSAFKVIRVK